MTVSAKTGNVSFEKRVSITPAASWTHQSGDTEAKREHDFDNWLQELVFATEGANAEMVAFIAEELRKMYRTANRKG